jgi:hypothetical protein
MSLIVSGTLLWRVTFLELAKTFFLLPSSCFSSFYALHSSSVSSLTPSWNSKTFSLLRLHVAVCPKLIYSSFRAAIRGFSQLRFTFLSVLKYVFIHSSSILSHDRSKTLPKRFFPIARSRAYSFKWEYPALSLRSSSSLLRLLPRLLVTPISPFIFPSITCFRRQTLRKMWPSLYMFDLKSNYM